MSMTIRFLGAAQNVTGSSYAVNVNGATVLVDCGLYQEREFKSRNWAAFPVAPERIAAVLLTHAHLDHCGLLPKLAREGFRGPVFCTAASAEIARIILLDSAKIQEEDALTKAKRHAREGRQGPYPDVPLYTVKDAEAVLPLFQPVEYKAAIPAAPGITAGFFDAGHILGSAMIKLDLNAAPKARTVLFTGDLGRSNLPILQDPAACRSADYIVMESTYGDRVHGALADIPGALARIVNAAWKQGGKVVVPAFAVERTQELIYYFGLLFRGNKIPRIPIFIDSPMAIRVTEVFKRHSELFDAETRDLIGGNGARDYFKSITMTPDVEASKAINKVKGPAVIIAGSGMCTGGRIKHHLVNTIGHKENTILFVGYQAGGTLGRIILDGAPKVRIFGQLRPVRARVARLDGFSAHADRDELAAWLQTCNRPPRRIFVTHGEAETARKFAAFIEAKTGWRAAAPVYDQQETLT